MQKLLLFVLVLAAIFYGRRFLKQLSQKEGGRARRGARGAPERMLACRQCGLHVPESEGVHRGEAFYCCDAHARGGDD